METFLASLLDAVRLLGCSGGIASDGRSTSGYYLTTLRVVFDVLISG